MNRQFQPTFLPMPSPENLFFINQQLLHWQWQANNFMVPWVYNMPWVYNVPFIYNVPGPFNAGPQLDRMTPSPSQHWQPEHQHQYRAPSLGPSRHRHLNAGFRQAETQNRYHKKHESSRTITGDHSTGANPGHAWITATDNPRLRVGKV